VINLSQANRQATIHQRSGGSIDAVLTRFTAVERLSEPFTIIADVIVAEASKTFQENLGDAFMIDVAAGPGRSRKFHGLLWEVAELDSDAAGSHYRLTLRPWASFFDLGVDSMMFQNKKVDEIAKDIVGLALRSQLRPKLRFAIGNYPPLEYCVQWQESDFDFISRLFERHGIYYYFKHDDVSHEMVATDQKSHHTPGLTGPIEVLPYSQGIGRPGGAIWSFARRFEVASDMGMVTDFDFLTPAQNQKFYNYQRNIPKTDWTHFGKIYMHPGGMTKATGDGRGNEISKRIAEAAQAETECITAEGDAFAVAVGSTIEIKAGPKAPAVKYLIIATTHVYTGSKYRSGAGDDDELTVQMQLIPATVQYRPAMKTPRPRIYGPQTAIVAGTDGEEIETDKHGRIKVHFHWDLDQQGGPTSSCWIRVAQSIAGKGWGAFTLPRIGQEVVVEFLNGDPDAPLVTGAVYNGENNTPYALPANKTRSTFKSRSSPKSQGFNELRFEDKAGSEEVYFHAEKDLNSVIDKGNETRTLNSGNRTTTISKGDETLEITKGKRTQTIQGDETLTIESGNRKEEISKGNDDLTIKMGNRSATIDMGNDTVTIKMGNQTIKLNMGKHTTNAMQGIDLICGGSSIKMTPGSIEIKSMSVKIEGSIAFETKGLIMKQEAGALHIVKGALVLIN
jgi:type VI secretion system secreted protein VgrG